MLRSDADALFRSQGFFIALRLVASAQAGNDVSLSNLSQSAAVPKFVRVYRTNPVLWCGCRFFMWLCVLRETPAAR